MSTTQSPMSPPPSACPRRREHARPAGTAAAVLVSLAGSVGGWAGAAIGQEPSPTPPDAVTEVTGGTGGTEVSEVSEVSEVAPSAPQAESTAAGGTDPGLEASPAPAPRIANPDLFSKSVRAAAEATRQYGLLEEHPDAERVAEIGYRIALASGFDQYPFSFGVVDLAIPNAFALPAGQIFITRGMLDLDLTDDQLAALLGHEVAHVTEEHFLRIKRRANLLNALAQVATIGAVVAAASGDDDYYQGPGGYIVRDRNPTADLAVAAQSTSVVLSELLLRSYSRDNEDESDEVGQRLAAAAGFDPDGARQLMTKMRTRIPQEKSFGYWQTHPFFDQRIDAAEARAKGLRAQPPAAADRLTGLRKATQRVLHEYEPDPTRGRRGDRRATGDDATGAEAPDSTTGFLESATLTAWPDGEIARRILADRLARLRAEEFERLPSSRDYGALIDSYQRQIARIARHDTDSQVVETLRGELSQLRRESQDLYPEAERIFERGVYETSFLESFLSNYPESSLRRRAALQLALACSRLGRESDAVANFLVAWRRDDADAAPAGGTGGTAGTGDDELAAAAARGLRNLAPVLQQLAALEQLATQDEDPELQELAARRLDEQASSFRELENGAAYLERFPDGLYVDTVSARMETLADTLYREMVLYQQIGDSAKAIARASRILELAPFSEAARRLGEQLEDQGVEP